MRTFILSTLRCQPRIVLLEALFKYEEIAVAFPRERVGRRAIGQGCPLTRRHCARRRWSAPSVIRLSLHAQAFGGVVAALRGIRFFLLS